MNERLDRNRNKVHQLKTATESFYMKLAPKPRPDSVPRHRLFAAVRSGARTAQIGRAAVILRKTPLTVRKSTRATEALSEYFAKNTSYYFQINPQSRTDGLWFFLQKRPSLYRKSTRAPETLSAIFTKTSSDFSQIKIQANFDYISFFQKIN